MKKRFALTLALAAVAILSPAGRDAEAGVDAVSAASLTVSVSNITATSATINYSKDRYSSGTRTLYYNPAPAAATQNATAKKASGNAGSFAVTGLKSGTEYNFKVEASDGRHKNYATSGTFKTLVPTAIPVSASPGAGGTAAERFDASGRRLDAGHARNGQGVIFTNRMAEPVYK